MTLLSSEQCLPPPYFARLPKKPGQSQGDYTRERSRKEGLLSVSFLRVGPVTIPSCSLIARLKHQFLPRRDYSPQTRKVPAIHLAARSAAWVAATANELVGEEPLGIAPAIAIFQ